MNVRILSRPVLLAVLPFFFVALLCELALAQGRPTDDSVSFTNVKETVSKLLLEPVHTATDERLLNEAGDSAALAITKIVSEQEMNSPETGRRILLILHLAFEAPQSV